MYFLPDVLYKKANSDLMLFMIPQGLNKAIEEAEKQISKVEEYNIQQERQATTAQEECRILR